jgi:hypothetical protein
MRRIAFNSPITVQPARIYLLQNRKNESILRNPAISAPNGSMTTASLVSTAPMP